jgi:predicted DNA-binding protein (MmcQ/YjbR family)
MTAKAKRNSDEVLRRLRAFGLAYPGAHTKSPWPGHLDLAVQDKTFAYLSLEGEPLSISCKLPSSCEEALMLPGAKPTPYGLGKWGWVSITFEDDASIPVEMLEDWIDESYRSQAPKKLVRTLEAREGGAEGAKPAATKAGAKKPPAKNASAKNASAKNAAAKKTPARKASKRSAKAR